MRWQIFVDRGGTFTDALGVHPELQIGDQTRPDLFAAEIERPEPAAAASRLACAAETRARVGETC